MVHILTHYVEIFVEETTITCFLLAMYLKNSAEQLSLVLNSNCSKKSDLLFECDRDITCSGNQVTSTQAVFKCFYEPEYPSFCPGDQHLNTHNKHLFNGSLMFQSSHTEFSVDLVSNDPPNSNTKILMNLVGLTCSPEKLQNSTQGSNSS